MASHISLRQLSTSMIAVVALGACGGSEADGDAERDEQPAATTVTSAAPSSTADLVPFADRAAAPCSTFAGDLLGVRDGATALAQFDYGPIYDSAAEALEAIATGEEEAATQAALVVAMEDSATAWAEFHAELDLALAALDSPSVDVMVTEGGKVYLVPGGDFTNLTESALDPALYLAVKDAEQAVGAAASDLDLLDCAPDVVRFEAENG